MDLVVGYSRWNDLQRRVRRRLHVDNQLGRRRDARDRHEQIDHTRVVVQIDRDAMRSFLVQMRQVADAPEKNSPCTTDSPLPSLRLLSDELPRAGRVIDYG